MDTLAPFHAAGDPWVSQPCSVLDTSRSQGLSERPAWSGPWRGRPADDAAPVGHLELQGGAGLAMSSMACCTLSVVQAQGLDLPRHGTAPHACGDIGPATPCSASLRVLCHCRPEEGARERAGVLLKLLRLLLCMLEGRCTEALGRVDLRQRARRHLRGNATAGGKARGARSARCGYTNINI